MDEIFTWKEVSDRSLWHLYSAIQHGADGGQPLFYTTAWLWAKAFGTGVLTLRLYSSVAMCAALLVTWRTIRRFYGMWATAFGVLAIWGTSGVLLEQNAEARFYGLYMLAVALTVDLYTRLVARPAPSRWLLVSSLLLSGRFGADSRLGLDLWRVDPVGIDPVRCLQRDDSDLRFISSMQLVGWPSWSGSLRFGHPWRQANLTGGYRCRASGPVLNSYFFAGLPGMARISAASLE